MSRLYPKDLENTHCVTITGDGQVAVISAWDRDNAATIEHYEVENVSRLREYCAANDITFLDTPSKPICAFEDGGEDYNRPSDSRFFLIVSVKATTEESALMTARQIADLYGAVELKSGRSTDCDWPKYPDLILYLTFNLYFSSAPNWDALPAAEFTLRDDAQTTPSRPHSHPIRSAATQVVAMVRG
jgi:hypothetical protein